MSINFKKQFEVILTKYLYTNVNNPGKLCHYEEEFFYACKTNLPMNNLVCER
jgi:hypothetical protein